MVHLDTFNKMMDYYNSNLTRYVKEHPNNYVLIEKSSTGPEFTEMFYKTKSSLNKALGYKKESFSATYFHKKIPITLDKIV